MNIWILTNKENEGKKDKRVQHYKIKEKEEGGEECEFA